jgi:pimeloyl-ACP methyl ester carboxylesterase
MWSQQLAALVPHFRLIAPDLRGFGKSEYTTGVVTMAQYADDLAQLLDALQIQQRVTLVGLSMGGYVGWEFLLRHRRRLHRLIMADTRAVADSAEIARGRELMADRVLQEGVSAVVDSMLPRLFAPQTVASNPAVVEETRRAMLANHPEGIAAALNGMARRRDMRSELPAIDLPTLLICGEHDEISTTVEMRELASQIPGARFEVISHAGHMAPLENGLATNELLKEFLQG